MDVLIRTRYSDFQKMVAKRRFLAFFIFRIFLGVGKNFRLLMQLCCFFLFFFSRPFHENFKFLKNCPYDFHSHSTPRGGSACAKASKSYGWDVRNIAKISPKMAKKQSFFDFFFDFLKNCPYDSNKNFYSHFLHHSMVLCVQFQ